jgi:hypothetical protein
MRSNGQAAWADKASDLSDILCVNLPAGGIGRQSTPRVRLGGVVASALRSYVTTGVALAGASVVAVTPIMASPPDVRVENRAVRLAADSVANVPVNLFYAIANIPYYEVVALNSWSDAVEGGGSWWLKTPTNVWGWDPGNPPMLEALAAVLVPIPVISGNGGLPHGITPNGQDQAGAGPSKVITAGNSILGGSAEPGTLGYILNVIAAAELPMHEGCGFTCDDVLTALGGYFQVPLSDLFDGYTFDPVKDANDPKYPVAWAGQTIAPIDPTEPFTNFFASLTADPSDPDSQAAGGINLISLQDVIHAGTRLDESATVAFNPWFKGSYLLTGFPLYDSDILFGGLVKGIIDRTFAPTPITSIPSTTTPNVTIDATPAPGGDVDQADNKPTYAIAAADTTPAASTQEIAPPSADLAPSGSTGLQRAINVAPANRGLEKALAATTKSTPATSGGNKFEPGQTAGAGGAASGGRLAAAAKAVTSKVTSTISKVTDHLKSATTGGASTESGE